MAAAQIKLGITHPIYMTLFDLLQFPLGLYDPALNSLETVLRCQPQNVKALYRKAKVQL